MDDRGLRPGGELSAMKLRKEQQRFGPWICKQRPAGDWEIDQIDRETMRIRRYGPYQTEAEAREMLAAICP